MKITVNKEIFLRAINTTDSIVSSKNINTILSNCLFNINKNKIEIIATDNEIAIKTQIDASTDEKLSFLTNGKYLYNVIKELPDEDITFTIDKSTEESFTINIKSSGVKGNYKFYGANSGEFPQIPSINNENSVIIEQAVFKDMIKKVIYAAATDTIKPVFNSI